MATTVESPPNLAGQNYTLIGMATNLNKIPLAELPAASPSRWHSEKLSTFT